MKKLLCVLAALTCAINLAACGSSSDSSEGTTTTQGTTSVTTDTASETTEDTTTRNVTTTATTKKTETSTETKSTIEAQTKATTEHLTENIELNEDFDLIKELGLDQLRADKTSTEVVITMPGDYYNDGDENYFKDLLESHNVRSVKENSDGTVSATLSRIDYEALMAEIRNEFDSSIQEILSDQDITTITDIKHNADYSAFEIHVTDQQSFEETYDAFSLVTLLFEAVVYNCLNGNNDYESTLSFRYFDANGNEFFEE